MIRKAIYGLAVAVASVGAVVPLPAQAAATPPAMVTRLADYGNWLGNDNPFRSPTDQITLSGSLERLQVDLTHAGSTNVTEMVFAPPAGQATLTPGTYQASNSPAAGSGLATMTLNVGERGCGTSEGSFTVLEATGLDHLLITYEMRCDGADPGAFGEVLVGDAANDPTLLLVPGRLDFPARYQGDQGIIPTVSLLNTGTKPITIAAHDISGDADFSVIGPDCLRKINPGSGCDLSVRFAPHGVGKRTGELRVEDSTGDVVRTLPLTGTGWPGHGFWGVYGEDGQEVFGTQVEFQPSGAILGASGTPSAITATWTTGDRFQTMEVGLSAGQGKTLTKGATVNDTVGAGAAATEPRITARVLRHLNNTKSECLNGVGTATLHDLAFGANGQLSRLSLTYEQRCAAGAPRLFGSIAWHSESEPEPTPGIAGVPPGPMPSLKAATDFDEVQLEWTWPNAPDYARAEVRYAVGKVAPPTLESGIEIEPFASNAAKLTDLDLGTAYSFSVFAVDTEGLISPPRSITVAGVGLTLVPGARKVAYGKPATFTGKAVDTATGAPMWGSELSLFGQSPDNPDDLFLIDSTRTDTKGRYSFSYAAKRGYDYLVLFAGDGTYLGGAAGLDRVDVGMRVDLKTDQPTVKHGNTAILIAKFAPTGPARAVQVQEMAKGKWKTIATPKLKPGSNKVKVKVAKSGTHTYRIVCPGDGPRASGTSPSVKVKAT